MIKKNITINLCGRLYSIDEDACDMIQHYTDTIRRYYSKEGNEDIADDIEMRIAELFDERLANGTTCISIEVAQSVINQIGDLDEVAPEAEQKTAEDKEPKKVKRGLYRDIENGVVCGVLSGFARFSGTSAGWWRLGFMAFLFLPSVMMLFASGFEYFFDWPLHITLGFGVNYLAILVYVLCALIMPKAIAPEDRLRMNGQSVTPQNIASEIQRKPNIQSKSLARCLLSLLFRLFSGFCGLILVMWLIAFFVGVGFLIMQPENAVAKMFNLHNDYDWTVAATEAFGQSKWFVIVGVVSAGAFLMSLIYCCFHAATNGFGRKQSMSTMTGLVFFIVNVCLLFSVLGCIGACVRVYREVDSKYYNEYIEQHTINGYFFNKNDEKFFKEGNWTLLAAENITDPRYTYSGEYPDGDVTVRYLDAYSKNKNMIYRAERCVEPEAGNYVLKCIARSSEDASGAFIYVSVEKDGEEKTLFEEIPGTGHRSLEGEPGNGWVNLKISDIEVPEGAIVKYGVTTDKQFTGKYCNAEWVSATDFELVRL